MSTQTVAPPRAQQPRAPLLGEAAPSPAGPAGPDAAIAIPPALPMAPWLQTLRFSLRQIEFVFRARRELGDVFRLRGAISRGDVPWSRATPTTCARCSPPSPSRRRR